MSRIWILEHLLLGSGGRRCYGHAEESDGSARICSDLDEASREGGRRPLDSAVFRIVEDPT